mmetsp:Transcript_12420/g.35541  ORF Transcript_12420/g.35541 Transcript_12420/m.35541 type:complete len:192 (-) Transcript_12420:53-628(-)
MIHVMNSISSDIDTAHAIKKRQRRSNVVSFAAPIVSKIHVTPREDADKKKASFEAEGYAGSALLFSGSTGSGPEECGYEEGGTLIYPPEEMAVTFAFPVVTQVIDIPECAKYQDKDELYYSSVDVAAFYLREMRSGRKIFGHRTKETSFPFDTIPRKDEGRRRETSTHDAFDLFATKIESRFSPPEYADIV